MPRKSISALLLVSAGLAGAQPIQVYSEFQRPGLSGEIVAADRAVRPREILSPAVVRNGYASFHVVVTVPPAASFWLHMGQNPDNAVRVSLYEEQHEKRRSAPIPDLLVPVDLPARGQGPRTYWMDIWVAPDAPARRIRLEIQLNIGTEWSIYPMEVRVLPAIVPEHRLTPGLLPPVDAPADRAALEPLRGYLCGTKEAASDAPLSVRRLIRRNALQDVALARAYEAKQGRQEVVSRIAAAAGAAGVDQWCASPGGPKQLGAEWYLRVRDLLYRGW